MIEKIELSNFKSARCVSIRIAALTVLAGLNGSGKSTTLQALALLKQSLDLSKEGDVLALRGPLVNMGRVEDVLFEGAQDDTLKIGVVTSEGAFSLAGAATARSDTLTTVKTGDIAATSGMFSGFQFIQADRLTPATQYAQASTPERAAGWLGVRGEYTVDFLEQNADTKVSPRRFCPKNRGDLPEALYEQVAPTDSLLDQTAGWMQQLSPGVRLRPAVVELADATSLRFEYTGTGVDSGSRQHRPGNVGFGLTYCLPIVVACLAAPPGSLLLLENPEAHLHPRGQFALGLLLASCASDEVQILVETHSDHVLNGIRVAAKSSVIDPENVVVHFFRRDIESGESTVFSPELLDNGRFSEWPEGFFDEWSKALEELLED
ncbi:DUF3696 domain-containing protein [Pseudoxanthomonas gei]|uniref:DUF3696 domain-containing protein n=1 Tax=Pseudoxanthomonas gei TaxID=1383030 RepID=A0ABX0ABT8_9GAMM|nr:DUF3696 domain-containing protein [Pseudoxanthomonas gei]NDK39032.1 DUF3696 domain-containing protein [Pseudoxanthomonas gei]